MTEEQYYQIAAACDSILLRSSATLEWIATPSLHLLSEHPIHLVPYQDIVDGPNSSGEEGGGLRPFGEIFRRGRLSARKVAGLARNVFRGAYTIWRDAMTGANRARSCKIPKADNVDVVIVSWLVNVDHLERMDDFYFGDLQSILADRGLSSVLVLRNQTGYPTSRLFERAWRNGSCSRLILPDVTRPFTELGFIRQCMRARRHLRHAEMEALSPLDRQVCRRAVDLLVSNAAVVNVRLHAQIADLCRHLRPSMAITLYEGHAWERCVWHAARTASLPVLCVGYQHTILRKHAYAVKRSLKEHKDYNPDLILAVGDVTQRILDTSPGLQGTRILTFGTHRRKKGVEFSDGPRSEATLLVLPEGNESECICLFEFAIECARRLPDARFIFRTHPVLPFERLESKLRGYNRLPDNVEVSRGRPIEDDFGRAAYLLYRGSSTVIYAILAGLKPFYIARPEEMDIDPLYELSEWRESAHSVDELVGRYRSHQARRDENSIGEWQRAREYCDRYVQPVRKDAIDEMIKLAGKLSEKSGAFRSDTDSQRL